MNGGGPFERGAVPWRCGAFPEAAAACKLTCGACGCQDSSVRFPVNNVTQSCEWVARTDTEARCMMDGLRFYCPVTCGLCEIELF